MSKKENLLGYEMTDEKKALIFQVAAKGADEADFKLLMHMAETYGLDPLAKEVWCVKNEKKPHLPAMVTTSRDGFLKIANSNPQYDGIHGDVICCNDYWGRNEHGNIIHNYGLPNRGPIVGAYAIVYRKDRKVPTYIFADFVSYNRNNTIWNSYPYAMILKVAEAQALKRAFGIAGLVTVEEMGSEVPDDNIALPSPAPALPVTSSGEFIPYQPVPAAAPVAAVANVEFRNELGETQSEAVNRFMQGEQAPVHVPSEWVAIKPKHAAIIKSLINAPAFTEDERNRCLTALNSGTMDDKWAIATMNYLNDELVKRPRQQVA